MPSLYVVVAAAGAVAVAVAAWTEKMAANHVDILCRHRIACKKVKDDGKQNGMKAIPFIEQHYSNILGPERGPIPVPLHSCLTNGNIIMLYCALDLLCSRIGVLMPQIYVFIDLGYIKCFVIHYALSLPTYGTWLAIRNSIYFNSPCKSMSLSSQSSLLIVTSTRNHILACPCFCPVPFGHVSSILAYFFVSQDWQMRNKSILDLLWKRTFIFLYI